MRHRLRIPRGLRIALALLLVGFLLAITCSAFWVAGG